MSGVARLERASGPPVWQKTFRPGRAYAQSVLAYQQVVPRWSAVRTPALLAHDPAARSITLSHLVGRPGSMQESAAWFGRAGAALRELHALQCPQDPDDIPLDVALERRSQTHPRVRALVNRHADRLRGPRRWCHRDFQPRNWMISDDGLGVLDFEHMRPDHPLVDWVRIEARGWTSAQRTAFQAAYGTPDPVAVRCVLAVYGASTVAWATAHADPELLAVGHRALAQAAP